MNSASLDINIIIIYVLLGLAGILFLFWIVLTIHKLKNRNQVISLAIVG